MLSNKQMWTRHRSTIMVAFAILLVVASSDAKKSKIVKLTADTWKTTLEGEWMIKFYAPWCPACKAMEDDYVKFAEWSDDLNINVAEVNINTEPGLSGRFIVTALPSLYHSKDGVYHRYSGARDSNALHRYIEDQQWRAVEPVAWYRHPNSIPMTLMSGLFQTSVFMKNFHETLTETYGLSTLSSYAIFGVLTIITGLTLGLIMVFIIDCIAPPKKGKDAVRPDQTAEREHHSEEEPEEEKAGTDDDGGSTGRESESDREEGAEAVRRKNSQAESSDGEEGRHSQASSKSSGTSQEWEQVQGSEAEEAENLSIEKVIPDEPEEGQELRKRVVAKSTQQDSGKD